MPLGPMAHARRAFLLLMGFGSAWITWASLDYFDFEMLPAFAIERLPVRLETLWLISLRVHVLSALFAFPLCLLLATRWLQRQRPWHRWIGRCVGVVVLCALVPSGLVLSLEAEGGAIVSLGFVLSAVIVTWFMVDGVAAARSKRMRRHSRAMTHVVLQMSVAVSSRAMIVGLDSVGMAPELAYVVALWVPVLGGGIVAEWLTRGRALPLNPFHLLQRSSL